MTQTPKMNKTEKFVNNMEVTRLFYPPSFDIFWYPGASDVGNLKFSLQFQTIDLEEGGEEMEEEDE
ncbi:CUB_2 domain-containing protein [Caenorhabditis elegans]|nr:CUB_2 domain-containing protein [Caenorhabditis elegans]CDR32635.1 CUB_2 domain-containing protein [Caenorhabditis elegans]|eukprot:NP_001293880.1 Uncharacterized protein CELE_K10D11.7 [Caenorhabditis elegans]